MAGNLHGTLVCNFGLDGGGQAPSSLSLSLTALSPLAEHDEGMESQLYMTVYARMRYEIHLQLFLCNAFFRLAPTASGR